MAYPISSYARLTLLKNKVVARERNIISNDSLIGATRRFFQYSYNYAS